MRGDIESAQTNAWLCQTKRMIVWDPKTNMLFDTDDTTASRKTVAKRRMKVVRVVEPIKKTERQEMAEMSPAKKAWLTRRARMATGQ